MARLGYVLIAAGFLAGAYFAVLDVETVPWGWFVGAVALGAAGVWLVRAAHRGLATHGETLGASISELQVRLSRAVESVGRLDDERDQVNVYDLRHRIDEEIAPDLTAFADAREAIAHRFGLQPYAEVMSNFAAGERYLNRVWSASTDGYIDEAHAYLSRAREQLGVTRDALAELVES